MDSKTNRPRPAEELTEKELESIVGGKEQLDSGQPDDESISVNIFVAPVDGSK